MEDRIIGRNTYNNNSGEICIIIRTKRVFISRLERFLLAF